MSLAILIKTLGFLLVILSGAMCIPLGYALFHQCETVTYFAQAAGATFAAGAALFIPFIKVRGELKKRAALLLVTMIWVMCALFGALPFYLSGKFLSVVDCIFESAAGFTTTGSTILTDIEGLPNSLLLWRSLTQFLGGMGIVVLSVAVMPLIGVGGMDLFRAESPGPTSDKISSRVSQTAQALWGLYLCFTVVEALLLNLFGMSAFDAVNHAMTTMASGGFSTKNASVAHFDSAAIDYTISIFMFLAGINFILFYKFLILGRVYALGDRELHFYFFMVVSAIVLLTLKLWGSVYLDFASALRYATFQVTSIASSTGYGTADYAVWPIFTQLIILFLMVVGGSAGSTAGGVKCIRVMVLLKHATTELRRVVHPRAVLPVKIGGKIVSKGNCDSIFGFVFLYLILLCTCTLILAYSGVDLLSAGSAVISALSNVGPALGEFGPASNYQSLSDMCKLVLSATMIIGRLEIITILVVFSPLYWRSLGGK